MQSEADGLRGQFRRAPCAHRIRLSWAATRPSALRESISTQEPEHPVNKPSVVTLITSLSLVACTGTPGNEADPATVTELAPCPSTPNCVSSADTADSHYIAPLTIEGDPEAAWQTLRDLLVEDGSFEITASAPHYIRAEATTRILRFTDDVEFLLDRDAGQIEMRSASRIGRSDMGTNRDRMEDVRSRMREAGAVRSD